MKKFSFLLSLILITSFSFILYSCAETKGEAVETENISAKNLTQTAKLAATAQIWEFLKYYHPQVAKGKIDWDNQLFKILKEVEKAETKEQLSATFLTWIDSLGKVEKHGMCSIHR